MKKILFGFGALALFIGGAIAVEANEQKGKELGHIGDYNIETLEKVTGKNAEELQVSSGQPLGEIAAEEGKLDEFHEEMVSGRKERLQQAVEEGEITQEEADRRIERMENNFETCDGTGSMMYTQRFSDEVAGRSYRMGGRGIGMGRCHN